MTAIASFALLYFSYNLLLVSNNIEINIEDRDLYPIDTGLPLLKKGTVFFDWSVDLIAKKILHIEQAE